MATRRKVNNYRERLNESAQLLWDAKVRPGLRKALRDLRSGISAEQCGHKSNRLIDATISFYGQYITLNEQVTLQNQDPKKYGVFKSSLIDLEALA